MTGQHLLPGNAKQLEKDIGEVLDPTPVLGPKADEIAGFKFVRPLNETIAPWLIVEYGLGPISRFFETIEGTIDDGIPWQRRRGTPWAVGESLGWIGYEAVQVFHQYPRREKWNRYQINMGELPPAGEVAKLLDAEYLADLSDPARSVPFRGFHGYDVRALEFNRMRWGRSIWGNDSGVRVPGGKMLWSHGQQHELTFTGDYAYRVSLGVDYADGQEVTWADDLPWDAPGVTWEGVQDAVSLNAWLISRLSCWMGFYDAAGAPIGYRRVIRVIDVSEPNEVGQIALEYTAHTGFGDGSGKTAANVALVFRANPVEVNKPGKLWLEPDQIVFEPGADPARVTVGPIPFSRTFKRTVREHVKVRLDLTGANAPALLGTEPDGLAIDFTDRSTAIVNTHAVALVLGAELNGLAVDFMEREFGLAASNAALLALGNEDGLALVFADFVPATFAKQVNE